LFVPSSDPPPEFLVDRSLGRYTVPNALRARGLVVHTLASVFGPREQTIRDEEWLRTAGRAGWIVLTKDERIRRRPLEVTSIVDARVRAFVLTKGQLQSSDQVRYLLNNMARLLEVARLPGPLIYAIYEHHVRRVWPI
jgi:uncharacterized protein with PIN domain